MSTVTECAWSRSASASPPSSERRLERSPRGDVGMPARRRLGLVAAPPPVAGRATYWWETKAGRAPPPPPAGGGRRTGGGRGGAGLARQSSSPTSHTTGGSLGDPQQLARPTQEC